MTLRPCDKQPAAGSSQVTWLKSTTHLLCNTTAPTYYIPVGERQPIQRWLLIPFKSCCLFLFFPVLKQQSDRSCLFFFFPSLSFCCISSTDKHNVVKNVIWRQSRFRLFLVYTFVGYFGERLMVCVVYFSFFVWWRIVRITRFIYLFFMSSVTFEVCCPAPPPPPSLFNAIG